MDLARAEDLVKHPPIGLPRDEWLDAYLTIQEDLHAQLAKTLAANREEVGSCATSTGAVGDSADDGHPADIGG